MKLTFLGAAGNVTGSRYLLEAAGQRILVDCGMYQERALLNRNWDPFPVPPTDITAVVLTHAHIDHCGYLPRLVKDGFKGRIFCTQVSAEIAKIVLEDSAKLQAEDAAYKKKRHAKEGRKSPFPIEPLYTQEDVQATCGLLSPAKYDSKVHVGGGINVHFLDAGHILGSSAVEMNIREDGRTRVIVFSGDIGRWDRPILRDPVPCPAADYVLVESTYGDRLHEASVRVEDQFATVINDTCRRGGKVIIPSFAIERAHEILYYLNGLLMANRIPHLKVHLDSPMAVKVVEVFKRHLEILDEDMKALLKNGHSPFLFPELQLTQSVEQSKALNETRESMVIIAGAGMCNGGRIKHHLANNISDPKHTVLFVGYQAEGTLGRLIVEGRKEVRIHGMTYPVRAQVTQVRGFSAHGDRTELLRWLDHEQGPVPKHVFVVHGEVESSKAFCETLRRERHWDASTPAFGDTVNLA